MAELNRLSTEKKIMLPTRAEAEELLKEAEKCNPGPWETTVGLQHIVLKKLLNHV